MTAADDREAATAPRGPAERAEPCPVPWPGLHAETNRCVFPYGHEVHWNGAGDVWLSDLAAAEARGVERGYRRAVERLRDDERYRNWWSQLPPDHPEAQYWNLSRKQLADYLEAVEGDQ